MRFYNPYLKIKGNNSPVELSLEEEDRKAWHNKIREEAYENILRNVEQPAGRRLRLEDFEEKYFL